MKYNFISQDTVVTKENISLLIGSKTQVSCRHLHRNSHQKIYQTLKHMFCLITDINYYYYYYHFSLNKNVPVDFYGAIYDLMMKTDVFFNLFILMPLPCSTLKFVFLM